MYSTSASITRTSVTMMCIQATSTWMVKSGAASFPLWIRSMPSYHHSLKTSSHALTASFWKLSYQCVWGVCSQPFSQWKNNKKFKKTTTTRTTKKCTSASTAAATAIDLRADVIVTNTTAENVSQTTSARHAAVSRSSLYKRDHITRNLSFNSRPLNEQHAFLPLLLKNIYLAG